MAERTFHTFEVKRRGGPDELDTIIAHDVSALLATINPYTRWNVRVSGGFSHDARKPVVRLSGEVSESLLDVGDLDARLKEAVARRYNSIHRSNFDADDFIFSIRFNRQSEALATNGHAGDAGTPIGYAFGAFPLQLPIERVVAVRIRNILDTIYQNDGIVPEPVAQLSGIHSLDGLRPDGKIGVDASYHDAHLLGLDRIVVSTQHDERLKLANLRRAVGSVVSGYLALLRDETGKDYGQSQIVVNSGTNPWLVGGWEADEGSNEAKPQRDFYGSHGTNEDSVSGEDCTKPSGTGSFLARHIAVTVAQRFAHYARVSLRYTIGTDDVVLGITTHGSSPFSQNQIESWVRDHIPLTIGHAADYFGLRDPAVFRLQADCADSFHGPFVWNKPFQESELLIPSRTPALEDKNAYKATEVATVRGH